MRVVLDTNVLLQILPGRSPYHVIFQHLIAGTLKWIVTYDIYLEYMEILQKHAPVNVDCYIHELLFASGNVLDIEVYYFFNLVEADPGDNKFVDAYLAGQGDYLITWDNHFKVLKDRDFPRVHVVNPDEFISIVTNELVN